jgi:2-keto-4-pentenoate hydratase
VSFDVERAAALLIEARASNRQIEPFAPAPASIAEAYAVQDAVARHLGPTGGWKVGAKSRDQTPNAAPLAASLVRHSPASWPASSLHMIGIEVEIAFRLGRNVLPRSGGVSRDEVWDAIASVHAAIEIVDTRLTHWEEADRLWVLADNQSNGGFVYAPDGVPLPEGSLAHLDVRLLVNGETAVEGTVRNPAGDPRWLVEWLVNHCAAERGGLSPGQLITTGSYTGMIFVDPGASVEARMQRIGAVNVQFPTST